MLLKSRTFRQFFLRSFLLCSLLIAILTAFAANRIHTVRFESAQQALLEESRLLYALIEKDLCAGKIDVVREEMLVLGEALGARFTLIDNEGKVIADTQADPGSMENHRLRPEVIEAFNNRTGSNIRVSHTVDVEMLYLARCEKTPENKTYFLRLAIPVSTLRDKLRSLDAGLVVAALIATATFAVACYLLAASQAAPIVELSQSAAELASGEFSHKTSPQSGELAVLATSLNSLGGSLSTLKSQAEAARAELTAMLESMSDGLIATDLNQRILISNPAAQRLLEISVDPIAGKGLCEIVYDEAVLKAATQAAAAGAKTVLQSRSRGGRHIEITVSPLGSPEPHGILIIAHDTTQSVQYQDLRKEFVANVSHELRTPLTVIKGFVETLIDGAVSDPVKAPQFLATIDKNVTQLTNLVSDLLEISKLEGRSGLPKRVLVDIRERTRKVVDLLAPAAQKKNQKLTIDTDEPVSAPGDPDYLERAISNLVENAIKYTPDRGEIHVGLHSESGSAVIEVWDTGIGIPAEDLPRIFERFYRVDKSRSREMGGTGLGLSIVKHIAQAHGGTVDVKSEPGNGSKFWIVLPQES